MKKYADYILIIGCFDTKAEVYHFLYESLIKSGERVKAINTGIMGSTELFVIDIEAEQVAAEAGVSILELRNKGDRGYAVDIMGTGATKVVGKLVAAGGVKGAIGMGGGGGTYITLSAMQAIPFGVPKICLSTLATKDLSKQIGEKDITLMPSIVDIAGLNSISKKLIKQAAAALCGMANLPEDKEDETAGRIAISMFGNTTACVNMCTELLKIKGYEVFAFHATGVGGMTMESLIRDNFFDAILDITTTELADELCGGILSAGPNRLEAAAEMGLPQVVVPGCLDMVNFGPRETVPVQYQSRHLYSWAPDVTLMRTDISENKKLGKVFIEKINRSNAAATVLLPLKGISQIDAKGEIFFSPETDIVLFETIKKYASDPVKVLEVDAHINSEEFAEVAVNTLITILELHKRKKPENH